LAWHPDGTLIAVGLDNNRVKIYDIKMQKLIQYYRVNESAINSIDFHPSGNYMIVASDDGKLKILDLLEGRQIYTITGHTGGVTAVKFSKDGQHFASGGDDKHIMLWKTNLDKECTLNSSESSSPAVIHVKSVSNEENDDEHNVKYTPDQSILLDPRKSDNYNLSDCIEVSD